MAQFCREGAELGRVQNLLLGQQPPTLHPVTDHKSTFHPNWPVLISEREILALGESQLSFVS